MDRDIERAVRTALIEDFVVPDLAIAIGVHEGWVTLCGSVALPEERDEAERIVRSIPMVRGITNHLGVWPSDLGSDVVRETIDETLARKEGDALAE
jgi:osmotically-inducible protein OsmY